MNNVFENWNQLTDELNLQQLVDEPTWFRTSRNKVRCSILDICYTNDEEANANVIDLQIGDHLAIMVRTAKNPTKLEKEPTWVRFWSNYTPEKFKEKVSKSDFEFLTNKSPEVHHHLLANALMNALESIAPERSIGFKDSAIIWSEKLLKIRRRKNNLLKKAKKLKNRSDLFIKCRFIDKEFKQAVSEEKKKKINDTINFAKGDNKNFWKAVNFAKNKQTKSIPPTVAL